VFVIVRDGDMAKALRMLKYKMQRQGIFREEKRHRFYTKPSDERRKKREGAIKRTLKDQKRRAFFSGEIPRPIKRKAT
jgi:small subunit ribosomal protein S21